MNAAIQILAAAVLLTLMVSGTAAACEGANGACCHKSRQASKVELSDADRAHMLAAVQALKKMGSSQDVAAIKAQQARLGMPAAANAEAEAQNSNQHGVHSAAASGHDCGECGSCDDCSDCTCPGHDSLDGQTATLTGSCPDRKHR